LRTQNSKAEKKKYEDEQKSSAAANETQARELEYLKGENKAMKVNEDQQMETFGQLKEEIQRMGPNMIHLEGNLLQ
jgi:hypothetical protein